MPELPSSPPHLAVVGGGVSGLAAAHRLRQLRPEASVQLFEAGPRLGGTLSTERLGELVLEHGADSFLTRDPVVVELCRELGLEGELIPTNAEYRRALVVCRGRLEPVPEGFVLMQPRNLEAVRRSPILGLGGKLRLLAEPLVRAPRNARESDRDESVASFATRRLGRQAFERLVEPLLAGIYVADATQLSLAATMPEFLAAERDHGSLRAALHASGAQQHASADPGDGPAGTGARYGSFVTLRTGMGTLVDALAASLPQESIRLSTPVASLAKTSNVRWQATLADGSAQEFDGVIIAGPAGAAARIVEGCNAQLSELLARIQAASSAVVTLIYRQDQIARPLDAFGFVVPRVENRSILAASFPSVKFPGRGTPAQTPIRVFLGGAAGPQAIRRDDAELIATAERELTDLLGIRGDPSRATVARWPASMPQYRVGHLVLVDAIERRVAAHAGLELAGASYRGVGIPQCVRSGRLAAERLVAG